MFNASSDLSPMPKQKPLGKDTTLLATEEHGRPVPYLAGRRRLGLTWISDAWGIRSVSVKRKVGKKKETVGYNYYASFAGVMCLGPVQTLHAIFIDDEQVWTGPMDAGTDDSASITIEGRGVITVYWGTETQEAGPVLAASGIDHPGYRGQFRVDFDDFLLGENRAQVPPIEFDLSRIPQGSGLATSAVLNGEAHPLAALEELILNRRFGAGLDAGMIDYDSWDAAAAQLATEGFSVSVLLDTATQFDALLNDFLEYLDASIVQTAAGKIGLRLLRASATPVALDAGDLTESPDLTAHGWPETVNEVLVRFSNRNRSWQTDSVAFRDPASYAVTRRSISQAVECDWVTDQAVAWKIAAGLARSKSLPWLDGTIRVRRGVADAVKPGDTVDLTYAPQGIDATLFRVLGVDLPGPDVAEVSLRVREDTSHLLRPDYVVPADDATTAEEYEPQPCHDVLIFEVPCAWSGDSNPLLLFLPARGETLSNRFTLHWERATNSYAIASEGEAFGLRGTLNAGLTATGELYDEAALDVTFSSPDNDLDDMPFTEGVEAQRFLIVCGDEVMFGFDPVLTGAARYTVSVMRGRKGTLRGDHAIGDEVWCVQLGPAALTEWVAPKSLGQVLGVKVQPHLLQREVPLSDITKLTHTVTRRSLRPLGPANLKAQGDGVNPTYGTGDNVVVSWTLTSEERDGSDPTVDLTSRADQCVLELWVGAVLKKTLYLSKTASPHTITNANLVTYLGSQVTFTVRAYLARGGYRSLDSDTITVTKV